MVKRIYSYVLIGVGLFVLGGCEDIFMENISDNSVEIVTPVNNAVLQAGKISFVWEELYGATNYRVVIVSPSFSNIQRYVCDSTLTATQLDFTLSIVGLYEWSIEAGNFGYKSLKSVSGIDIR